MSATVRIHVTDSGFDCETCANTVEQVLKQTAGVEDVQIDEETSQLAVGYDVSQIAEEEIQNVVADWGYTLGGGGWGRRRMPDQT